MASTHDTAIPWRPKLHTYSVFSGRWEAVASSFNCALCCYYSLLLQWSICAVSLNTDDVFLHFSLEELTLQLQSVVNFAFDVYIYIYIYIYIYTRRMGVIHQEGGSPAYTSLDWAHLAIVWFVTRWPSSSLCMLLTTHFTHTFQKLKVWWLPYT
jgi:hypothetical protein